MKYLISGLVFLFISCKYTLGPPERYIINKDGIKSRTGCIIENLSISQYNRDHNNLHDIRPIQENEITRYCCWLNPNSKGSNKISFREMTPNYRWYLCKVNMNILENDSLNNMPLQEKLDYAIRMEQSMLNDKNYVHRDSFPITIQKGYVYRIFGVCDVEGSYYVCLDSSDELIVQYFEKGPW